MRILEVRSQKSHIKIYVVQIPWLHEKLGFWPFERRAMGVMVAVVDIRGYWSPGSLLDKPDVTGHMEPHTEQIAR